MITTQLPALGLIAPPPGVWGASVAALQCLSIMGNFNNEINNPTLYSKFAANKEFSNPISSRNGMFRIYIPSMIVAAIYTFWNTTTNTAPTLVAPLLFLHFLKRVLEVAFVHKYSGTMPAASGNMIGTYYALITLLMASTAVPVHDVQYAPIGLALFVIGQVGNFYHHYLLSTLRKKESDNDNKNEKQRYVAPTSGLFDYVAAPHYLFELVAWLGMAVCAQQLNALLVFASMVSYLSGRAYKTNQLYSEQFEEWPKSRKALIPGIF